MKTDRILIINPFGIGDILFTTPLIRRLRRQFKDSFIGFLCNGRTAPLLEPNKNIDEIFVFDKDDYRGLWSKSTPDKPWYGKSRLGCLKKFIRFLKTIKSRNFDVAIDLSLGHQYAFFLMLFGVPTRIGYNFKGRGRFLSHKLDTDSYYGKSVVEHHLDLFDFLCREAGVSPLMDDDNRLQVFISTCQMEWADAFLKANGVSASDRLLGVVPAGGASWGRTAIYKHWSWENFAKVADELSDGYKAKILLLGSQDEIGICEGVSNLMRNKPILACAKTDLLQFAALLKKCCLVLCNDGGALHMAVAMGTKTVSIFGPVDENVYGPYPPSAAHIVIKEDINCRPCYKRFKFQECSQRLCLLNIRPQDVAKAAERLLS